MDGKPRSFHQLLGDVDLSHNTMRLHLNDLVDQALVTRQKVPRKGRGKPVLTYFVGPRGSGARARDSKQKHHQLLAYE